MQNQSSLKQKLYDLVARQDHHKSETKKSIVQESQSGFSDLDVQWLSNEYGSCLTREKHFSLDQVHGVPIREFLNIDDAFVYIGKDHDLCHLRPDQIAFIDTETTGLAGGTGTYIFLTGIGYFTQDSFCVRQFFMSEYKQEAAFLHEITRALQDKKGLISFNGKSYDIPLLRTRNTLNRIKFDFDALQHIDLLHTSRRLWRKFLPQCTLSALEEFVLGFRRHGDIAGAEIPATFFRFLRNRDFSLMKPIFQHNAMDIVSLVSLAIKAAQAFSSQDPSSPRDVISIVKTYEHLNLYEQASEFCLSSVDHVDAEISIQLLLRHARMMKKLSRFAQAEQYWLQVIDKSAHFIPEPYIELAKCYEHHHRDYHKALNIIQRGQSRAVVIQELHETDKWEWVHQTMEHRKQRIIAKIKMRTDHNGDE